MNEANQHFQTDLSVGEILRRTRMHYNQTLPDIERALRIRATQLEALENGNYAALPGRVYVIGFIRSYSEYLGLDGDKMVNLFKVQVGNKIAPAASVTFPVQASDTKVPQFWQVGLSVFGVLLVLVIWWTLQGHDRKLVTEVPPVSASRLQADVPEEQVQAPGPPVAPPAQATVPQPDIANAPPQPVPVVNGAAAPAAPVSAAPATQAPATSAAITAAAPAAAAPVAAAPDANLPVEQRNGVILNIKVNSWVEIRGKDGKSIVSRVLKAGDRYYVPDRPDLTISLGNSGGVELEVHGQKLKPLGNPGEVKRNIPLDAEYLRKNYALGVSSGND